MNDEMRKKKFSHFIGRMCNEFFHRLFLLEIHATIIVEEYNKNWMFQFEFNLLITYTSLIYALVAFRARDIVYTSVYIYTYTITYTPINSRLLHYEPMYMHAVMLQLESIYTYPRCVRSTFLLQRRTHDARGNPPDSTNKNRINGHVQNFSDRGSTF